MRLRTESTLASFTRSPAKRTSPESGSRRPFIRRSSVDLPQPLDPMSTVVRPPSISRSIGPRENPAPNAFETAASSSTPRL
jgi:hypothetical protein